MKELTLNPDGVLNIINPRKTYIFKILVGCGQPNYWINTRTPSGSHCFKNINVHGGQILGLFSEPYLQYSCEYGIKFLKRHYPDYSGGLYQFDSEEDFIQCHARGEL